MGALSVIDAFRLLYDCEPTAEEATRLRAILSRSTVSNLSDLRAIAMAYDRQTRPTRAIVRFASGDLRRIDLAGFRLFLDAADLSVSSPILAQGGWEPHLTDVFRHCIGPGMRVADVGANVGYYAMLAASLVQSKGEVLAFEPNSENCRLLLLSAAENGFANIRLFPLALAASTGHAHFTTHIGSNGGFVPAEWALATGHGSIVPTVPLDALVAPPLDFIKMDVEGAEFGVLLGADSLIQAAQPVITTELSCEMISRVSGCAPREFLRFFETRGYAIHLVPKDATGPVRIDDVDGLLRDWGDLGRIEDLLMLPRGRIWA